MEYYFEKLTNNKSIKNKEYFYIITKNKTINKWNFKKNFYLYQGRYSSLFTITPYHIHIKYGELTKTRKPFFFRGKKKR